MDDLNFCPKCGKNLSPGIAFCPACGARLDGREGERKEDAAAEKAGGDRIRTAFLLLLVNAVILFLFGIIMFVAMGMADSMLETYPDLFAGYTTESMRAFIQQLGVSMIAAGAISLAAAFLTFKRRLWIVVFILCIIATVLGITTVICAAIGVIALYMVYKSKASFTD